MTRLSAATDVADELLQRVIERGQTDPWAESPELRSRWRKANGYPLQEVRSYRNRLLHGRLTPVIHAQIVQTPGHPLVPGTSHNALVAPKIGAESRYLDWRVVLGSSRFEPAIIPDDFDLASNIVGDAWSRVLAYLEREWEKILIPKLA